MKNVLLKSAALICAAVFIISLAACGGTNQNTKASEPAQATSAPATAAPVTESQKAETQTKTEIKTETPASSLEGSWEYVDGGFVYTFNSDGTGTYDIYGSVEEFTYKSDGSVLTITYDEETGPMDLEYSIDGDTLNIKDSLGNDTLYKRK